MRGALWPVLLVALPALLWLGHPRWGAIGTARDRALWLLAAAGCVWLMLARSLGFGLVGLVLLCHWRAYHQQGWILAYGGAVVVWEAARATIGHQQDMVTHGWVGWAAAQSLWAALDVWLIVRRKVRLRPGPQWAYGAGTLGHRTLLAGLLALAWPWALAWHWGWALALVPGLLATSSWLAWLGVGAASVVLWPWLAWPVAGLVGLAVLDVATSWRPRGARGRVSLLERWTTRGDSLDTLWARARVTVTLLRAMPRWGAGLRQTDEYLLRQTGLVTQYARAQGSPLAWMQGHAHNDVVEWCFETGWPGVVAVAVLVVELAWGWRLGSPLSACLVVVGLLSVGTFAWRVAPLGIVMTALVAWGIGR